MLSMLYTLHHLLSIINSLFNLGRQPLFYCAKYLKVNMNGVSVIECRLVTIEALLFIRKSHYWNPNHIGNLYSYFS